MKVKVTISGEQGSGKSQLAKKLVKFLFKQGLFTNIKDSDGYEYFEVPSDNDYIGDAIITIKQTKGE